MKNRSEYTSLFENLPLVILLICLMFACSDLSENKFSVVTDPPAMSIVLQPFESLSNDKITYVSTQLSKIYPHIKIKTAIKLPASAYYAARQRYRADSLIRYLKGRTTKGEITIGLTDRDISTAKGEIRDYGIMGLAYQPGSSCVVSTFRLSKNNLLDQFFKLAIHELGHTQGLPHCPEKTCFMRDAEGKNHTDEEKAFCDKCRNHLVSKGWSIEE